MVKEEQHYHKLHQKQIQAEQDSAWMHTVPEWHDAELVGQNKPWTLPSQLLTVEEEVCAPLLPGIAPVVQEAARKAHQCVWLTVQHA